MNEDGPYSNKETDESGSDNEEEKFSVEFWHMASLIMSWNERMKKWSDGVTQCKCATT